MSAELWADNACEGVADADGQNAGDQRQQLEWGRSGEVARRVVDPQRKRAADEEVNRRECHLPSVLLIDESFHAHLQHLRDRIKFDDASGLEDDEDGEDDDGRDVEELTLEHQTRHVHHDDEDVEDLPDRRRSLPVLASLPHDGDTGDAQQDDVHANDGDPLDVAEDEREENLDGRFVADGNDGDADDYRQQQQVEPERLSEDWKDASDCDDADNCQQPDLKDDRELLVDMARLVEEWKL